MHVRHKPDMRPAGAGGVQVARLHLRRVGDTRAAVMIYVYLFTCVYVLYVHVLCTQVGRVHLGRVGDTRAAAALTSGQGDAGAVFCRTIGAMQVFMAVAAAPKP